MTHIQYFVQQLVFLPVQSTGILNRALNIC